MADEVVIYAFGDSIIKGHCYPEQGSVEHVAASLAFPTRVIKMARNGATICPSALRAPDLGGQILKQCDEVPADAPLPDLIVFNGMTNDIYQGFVHTRMGAMTGEDDYDADDFDHRTFAGCLEATIAEFHRRWPSAPIIYLAVHKNGSIDFMDQLSVHKLIVAVCAKWNVAVADVWNDADLDTRKDSDRIAYSFDALGADGLPSTPATAECGRSEYQPSGTHPNFPAIDRYYRPILGKTIRMVVRR